MHPAWTALLLGHKFPQSAPSSRLASRVPRHPRCVTVIMTGTTKRRGSRGARGSPHGCVRGGALLLPIVQPDLTGVGAEQRTMKKPGRSERMLVYSVALWRASVLVRLTQRERPARRIQIPRGEGANASLPSV